MSPHHHYEAILCNTFFCRVRTSVIEVEYPLIETQLQDLDSILEKAISKLTWTSNGSHIIITESINALKPAILSLLDSLGVQNVL